MLRGRDVIVTPPCVRALTCACACLVQISARYCRFHLVAGNSAHSYLRPGSAHAVGLRVDGGQTGRYVSLEGNALLPSPAVGEHQPPKKKKEQKQRGHSGLKSELQKSIGDGEDQSVAAQVRKGPEDFRSSERKSAAAAAAEQLKTEVSASALNANKLHLR